MKNENQEGKKTIVYPRPSVCRRKPLRLENNPTKSASNQTRNHAQGRGPYFGQRFTAKRK